MKNEKICRGCGDDDLLVLCFSLEADVGFVYSRLGYALIFDGNCFIDDKKNGK